LSVTLPVIGHGPLSRWRAEPTIALGLSLVVAVTITSHHGRPRLLSQQLARE
jgi:hypothetical protein